MTYKDKLEMLKQAALKNDEQTAVAALHEMVPTFVAADIFNKNALNEMENAKSEEEKEFQTT